MGIGSWEWEQQVSHHLANADGYTAAALQAIWSTLTAVPDPGLLQELGIPPDLFENPV